MFLPEYDLEKGLIYERILIYDRISLGLVIIAFTPNDAYCKLQ